MKWSDDKETRQTNLQKSRFLYPGFYDMRVRVKAIVMQFLHAINAPLQSALLP